MLHRRALVALYKPQLARFIGHYVEAIKTDGVWPPVYVAPTAHDCRLYNVLYLRQPVPLINPLAQMLLELFEGPHVADDLIVLVLVLFLNRVVCQVRELVSEVGTVVLAAEPDVPLFIHINSQRVPAVNHHPHSEIELALHNQHRVLYIFLNHPPSLLPLFVLVFRGVATVPEDRVIIVKDCDVTTPRKATGLSNPQVFFPIEL